jgi:hypothetical protein
MTEKKTTPRSTIIVAVGLVAGLAAVQIGQKQSAWVMASSANTAITAAIAAVIGGAIAWFATRPR